MKITPAEAAPYFAHPSQRKAAMLAPGQELPEWCSYYAAEGICGAFHDAFWPGAIMGHLGALPRSWGRLVEPATAILREAAADFGAEYVIGWIREDNRAACRFAERLGFTIDGRLRLEKPVVCYGWRP